MVVTSLKVCLSAMCGALLGLLIVEYFYHNFCWDCACGLKKASICVESVSVQMLRASLGGMFAGVLGVLLASLANWSSRETSWFAYRLGVFVAIPFVAFVGIATLSYLALVITSIFTFMPAAGVAYLLANRGRDQRG